MPLALRRAGQSVSAIARSNIDSVRKNMSIDPIYYFGRKALNTFCIQGLSITSTVFGECQARFDNGDDPIPIGV